MRAAGLRRRNDEHIQNCSVDCYHVRFDGLRHDQIQRPDDLRIARVVFPGVDGNIFGRHSMTLFAAAIKIAASSEPPQPDDYVVNYSSPERHLEIKNAN